MKKRFAAEALTARLASFLTTESDESGLSRVQVLPISLSSGVRCSKTAERMTKSAPRMSVSNSTATILNFVV